MANIFDRLVERIEQRLTAAIELPDEAHRCPACNDEGYVLDVWPNEKRCEACGGTGLKSEKGEA